MITRLLALTLALGANAALAEPLALLSAQEVRDELFGVHMFGVTDTLGFDWDECIEPSGLTVYRTIDADDPQPYSQQGLLQVNDLGMACFSYPPNGDPSPSCFQVYRNGDGYIFANGFGDGRYITTKVLRNITICPEPGALLG